MNIKGGFIWAAVLLCLGTMGALQAMVEYGLLKPLAGQLDQLSAENQRKHKNTVEKGHEVPKTLVQMNAILLRLPGSSQTNDRLKLLHQKAERYGVLLRKVSYRDFVLAGPMVRKEMLVDFSGTYPSVREYLRSVLVDDEAIAVDALEFNRSAEGTGGQVRGQVRLALYSSGSSQ
jgi:Tfp pilus assembly protein PilO